MINKKITPVKITISNWVVWEWSPTLFTTLRTKTNSLQGARANASHTLQPIQANNNNVWRPTGRAGDQTTAACTQTRCTPLYVWGSELESERKCLWEREREKARVGVKVELSSKQSQILPPPPQSQVNWIIRSQGRYRHLLPWIAHQTTSVWLHRGKPSSLRTLSLNIQGTLNEEVMNLS